MARTPRSAAEKLAMRKKKSRALLLFNIIAFSVVVIGAVLLLIFFFFIYDDKPAAKLPAGPDGKDVSAASKEAADGGQIADDSSGDGGKTD